MESDGEIWINTGFYGNHQGTMLELIHEDSHLATDYGMRPWKYSTASGSLDEQEAYLLQLNLYVELKRKYPKYTDFDMERLLQEHPKLVKAKAADKWQTQRR